MPSPDYATTPVYGLRALKGDSLISDIDAGFLALAQDAEAMLHGAVPRLGSLPTVGPLGSGPLINGQECYLGVAATNGVQWHLRYNAGSSSAYKWEYVGGPPMFDQVDTNESTTATTFGDLTTVGPQATLPTLPNGGEFIVRIGASIGTANAANAGGFMSFAVGGTPAALGDSAGVAPGNAIAASVSVYTRRFKTIPSAAAIVAKYRSQTGNSVSFAGRFIEVLPIRVG